MARIAPPRRARPAFRTWWSRWCDYGGPDIQLATWSHALVGYPHDELGLALAKIRGLECRPETLVHARALLARREAIAYVVCGDGHVDTLHGGGDLRERTELLNRLVDAYHEDTRFLRVASDSLGGVRARHPDVTALVVFPHFEPDEVVELALSGARAAGRDHAPPGALARAAPQRADRPAGRRHAGTRGQERWLKEWIDEKLRQRRALLRGIDGDASMSEAAP